jgi:hypothetical protein
VRYLIPFCSIAIVGVLCAVVWLPLDARAKLTCVKERKVVLWLGGCESASDLLSIPLICAATADKIPCLEFVAQKELWNVTALYISSVGEFMVELPLKYKDGPLPLIAFVQDLAGDEYLMTISTQGECALSSLPSLLAQSVLVSKQVGDQHYLAYAPRKGEPAICYFQRQL